MDDDNPLSLSALNHFLYCPRRCALTRIEGVWVDNAHTLSGTISHEKADDPRYRQSADALGVVLRIERALPLYCRKLNLVGKGDIVEFHRAPNGGPAIPHPVDYKLGAKRKWDNDDVQLCAQAICLEEMIGVPVPTGSVYHVKSRHRRRVEIDANLRMLTLRVIEQVRDLLAEDVVPPAEPKPQCEGCSLEQVCMPKLTRSVKSMGRYRRELFARDGGWQQRPEPFPGANHG